MKDYAPTLQFEAATLDLSPVKAEEPAKAEQPAKHQIRWLPFGVLAVIAIAAGGFFWLKTPSVPPGDFTPTVSSASPSATDTLIQATFTSTYTATPPAGPIGIIRFQNGSALADQVSLITQSMPAPPPGGQYEIWLIGTNERISLGIFIPDTNGKSELTFTAPDGANLISRYDKFEITIEPLDDMDPEPSGLIAYSFTLPAEGITHIRYLLSAFSRTPDQNALVQGLYVDIKQIAELTEEIQNASESSDLNLMRQKAETALNLVVGAQSADYKDWNGDGKIDPRKSYGLLLNGSEFGYIQAVHGEADYITSITGATEYMIANGEVVKTCTQNMAQWAPDLRKLLLAILNSTSDAETAKAIQDRAVQTDQILHGIDADKNGKVDPVAGECGAEMVYEYAYHMVDMPILRISISYQLTVVAGFTPGPTSATQNGSGGQVIGTPKPTHTQKPAPTQKDPPTKKPAPTEKPPGGGGPPPKTPKK
jgi:hypothetical protein